MQVTALNEPIAVYLTIGKICSDNSSQVQIWHRVPRRLFAQLPISLQRSGVSGPSESDLAFGTFLRWIWLGLLGAFKSPVS